jgi:hypothetical protein
MPARTGIDTLERCVSGLSVVPTSNSLLPRCACLRRITDEPVAEIVQCGEPINSIIYGHSIFRPIFTLPFSEPISCGFFFGVQEHPDARIGSFVRTRAVRLPSQPR